MVKSVGNQVQASESLFLVESHRIPAGPPATDCNNMHEMLSAREAYQMLRAPSFCWSLIMYAPSA